MQAETTTTGPRVFVTCLAAYNHGTLHGEWVTVPTEAEDLRAEVARILAASPVAGAEEWFFTDWEGIPVTIAGEYAELEALTSWAAEVEAAEAAGVPFDALWAYAENDWHQEVEGMAERCQEDLRGRFDSLEDFAWEFAQECGAMPTPSPVELRGTTWDLVSFVDWKRAANDLVLGGDFWHAPGAESGVLVFWSR